MFILSSLKVIFTRHLVLTKNFRHEHSFEFSRIFMFPYNKSDLECGRISSIHFVYLSEHVSK